MYNFANGMRLKRVLLGVSIVNILLLGGVFYYELTTCYFRIVLSDLCIIQLQDVKRPDYYWIKDWTECIRKLNYKADVAFFGNSITAGSNFQKIFPNLRIVEFGHCGDRVDGMCRRISMVCSVNPDIVFLMGGINDLHRSKPETVLRRYDKLLANLRDSLPNTRIYVQSILPISKEMEKRYAPNEVIQETNIMIQKCANKHGCNYIDLYDIFVEDGQMPDSLTSDGVHLSSQGYYLWAESIKQFLIKESN